MLLPLPSPNRHGPHRPARPPGREEPGILHDPIDDLDKRPPDVLARLGARLAKANHPVAGVGLGPGLAFGGGHLPAGFSRV